MAEKYIPQNVLDALPKRFETKTVQTPTGRMGGGFYENQVVVPPPNAIPITAPQFAMGGARDVPTGEYYIPLDIPNYPKTDAQGYPVPPLTAKYDASGNLQTITTQRRYLADGNIAIQPEYNLSGELVSTNAVNNAEGEGGGFGDFVSTAFKDFAPMIALAAGSNYLLGSGLLGGSAATTGAATTGAATGGAAAAGGAVTAGTGVTSSVLSAISKATGIEVDTLKTLRQ